MAFLYVSQQGEFKNTTKTFWEKSMSKLLTEKVEEKNFFLSSSHRFVLIAFLAVSLHEDPKNTTKTLSKIRPENLKKTQKK
jgi:hypothetical protein